MMTAAAFLGIMMLLASDTAIGRSMRYWLIERPAARLARVTTGQVLLLSLSSALPD